MQSVAGKITGRLRRKIRTIARLSRTNEMPCHYWIARRVEGLVLVNSVMHSDEEERGGENFNKGPLPECGRSG